MRGGWARAAALVVIAVLAASTVGASSAAGQDARSTDSYLWKLKATGGAFGSDETGADTLRLTGIDRRSAWSRHGPDQASGAAPVADALSMVGFGDGPVRAVLTVSGADAAYDSIAISLTDPRFDRASSSVLFDVEELAPRKVGARLASHRPRLDGSAVATFDGARLVMDDPETDVGDDGAPVPSDAEPVVPDDGTPITPAPDTTPATEAAPEPTTPPTEPVPETNDPEPDFTVDLYTASDATPLSVDIVPLWDAYNNCIVEGTPNRFLSQEIYGYVPGRDPHQWLHLVLRAERNKGGVCAFEQSRMHWMYSVLGGRNLGKVEIRANGRFLQHPDAECIDRAPGLEVDCNFYSEAQVHVIFR